jgi:DNA-binding MarR family transcriptional regulator
MPRESTVPAASREGAYEHINRELLTLGRRVRSKPPLVTGDHPYLDSAIDALCSVLAERGPMRLTDVADALWLDKSTVTRQVATLHAAGLAGRVADPTDGRATLVELTDDGRSLLGRVRQGRREGMAEVFKGWTAEEVASFASLLGRYNRTVEDLQRPRLVAIPGRRRAAR